MTELRTRTLPLMTLAATAFVYVTAETLPVGLLPEISAGLDVSESRVGLLLTFYAYAVAIVTMPLIRAVTTWDRRTVVVITAAALAVSQLVSALSFDYWMLVIARMVCAATHGVFWAVVAPVAASLAKPGQKGKAIATVYAGTSLALVAGNPLTAALGQWLGWRVAAATLGVVAIVTTVALIKTLPNLPATVSSRDTKKGTIGPILLLLCGATFLAVLGQFTGYTYFSLLVGATMGGGGTTLSLMLFVYGLAGVAGIWAIGRTYDRWPWRSTVVVLATVSTALALLLLGVTFGPATGLGVSAIAATALWGLAFTTIPVCLQSAVMRSAPQDADRASAIYVVVFQVGIASGALLGGGIIDNAGLSALVVTALTLMVAALALVSVGKKAFRSEQPDLATV
ncbi:MFS transporter [Rhodococcoides trifolii]|uniref:MFS transporter n=1 Tax=Rhodococcoides trifolii TaxID=908250 RepID=A0A917CTX9_9NOCA|nr:MFS transporter [Rhodococcus trifolii]GGF96770.1 MFS transporter [Rhodococcus trifolii]